MRAILSGMSEKTEILYNASCPICSREVNHYQRLSRAADLPIAYDDLSDAARLTDWGVTKEQAAKRLHLRQNGQMYSGLPAFILLWQQIPRTRWLARLFSLPGLHWMAIKAYDHLAAPLLYALHQRRQRRS